MEKESRNDWKRGIALLIVIIGIIFLGLVLFNQTPATITGASVATSTDVSVQTGIILVASLIFLVLGGVFLYKLNQ